MYQLGKQFEIDYTNIKPNDKSVIQGKKFRITVLTERVVRLEFSESGVFVDRPTQLIINRNTNYSNFKFEQDNSGLRITNKFFVLDYVKEKPFLGSKIDPMKNLKITLRSPDKDRCKDWYFGHPEARNMNGNMISVDVGASGYYTKGLYSLDGFASINDSLSKILMEDGTLVDPPENHTDLYVFMYDHDFKHALADYFKITGEPALIPRYALGNWWSRNIKYNDKNIPLLVKNFERKRIPLAVMLFDNDWHYRDVGKLSGLKTGFTFNPDLFPNPQLMIQEFPRRGVRVGLCINPTNGIYPFEVAFRSVICCQLFKICH